MFRTSKEPDKDKLSWDMDVQSSSYEKIRKCNTECDLRPYRGQREEGIRLHCRADVDINDNCKDDIEDRRKSLQNICCLKWTVYCCNTRYYFSLLTFMASCGRFISDIRTKNLNDLCIGYTDVLEGRT
jgi:hypothetical protein